MKNLKKILLVIATTFCLSSCVRDIASEKPQPNIKEKEIEIEIKEIEIDKQFPVSSNVHLTIKNINGPITIVGHNKNIASLQVIKRGKDIKDLEKVKIINTLKENEIICTTKHGDNIGEFVSVEYKLTVPFYAVVKLARTINGDITTDYIKGPLKLKTTNGKITSHKTNNSVKATSVNGSIEINSESLAEKQTIDITTVNGSIALNIPGNLHASYQAQTMVGNISSNIPTTYESSHLVGKIIKGIIGDNKKATNTIKLSSTNGNISINSK